MQKIYNSYQLVILIIYKSLLFFGKLENQNQKHPENCQFLKTDAKSQHDELIFVCRW